MFVLCILSPLTHGTAREGFKGAGPPLSQNFILLNFVALLICIEQLSNSNNNTVYYTLDIGIAYAFEHF